MVKAPLDFPAFINTLAPNGRTPFVSVNFVPVNVAELKIGEFMEPSKNKRFDAQSRLRLVSGLYSSSQIVIVMRYVSGS